MALEDDDDDEADDEDDEDEDEEDVGGEGVALLPFTLNRRQYSCHQVVPLLPSTQSLISLFVICRFERLLDFFHLNPRAQTSIYLVTVPRVQDKWAPTSMCSYSTPR